MKVREQIVVVNMSHPLSEDAKNDIRKYYSACDFEVEFQDFPAQLDLEAELYPQYLAIAEQLPRTGPDAVILPGLSWVAGLLAARWAENCVVDMVKEPDIIVLGRQGVPPTWRLKEVL